jgi:hypothetical protein
MLPEACWVLSPVTAPTTASFLPEMRSPRLRGERGSEQGSRVIRENKIAWVLGGVEGYECVSVGKKSRDGEASHVVIPWQIKPEARNSHLTHPST